MGQSCCAAHDEKAQEASIGSANIVNATQEHALENAAMDPGVGFPEAVKDEPQKTIELLVTKEGDTDRLGMDVKHLRGRLVIVQLFPGHAVDRANVAASKRGSDVLEEGDVIVQVNDVKETDAEMVKECQSKNELRIRAVRRL